MLAQNCHTTAVRVTAGSCLIYGNVVLIAISSKCAQRVPLAWLVKWLRRETANGIRLRVGNVEDGDESRDIQQFVELRSQVAKPQRRSS
jgi:hypothetical protein